MKHLQNSQNTENRAQDGVEADISEIPDSKREQSRIKDWKNFTKWLEVEFF